MPDGSAKTRSYSEQLAAFTHGLRYEDIPDGAGAPPRQAPDA
jgi:hypothetical protein